MMDKKTYRSMLLNYIIGHGESSLLNKRTDLLFVEEKNENSAECKAYKWIKNEFQKNGVLPNFLDYGTVFPYLDKSQEFDSNLTIDDVIKNVNNSAYNIEVSEIISNLFKANQQGDVSQMKSEIDKLSKKHSEYEVTSRPAYILSEKADEIYGEYLARCRGTFKKISTGFSALDKVLGGGLQSDDYVVLLGHPGEGKSMFASKLAANLLKKGLRVMYFNGEMSNSEVTFRILTMLDQGLNLNSLIDGKKDVDDMLKRIKEEIKGYKGELIIVNSSTFANGKCTAVAVENFVKRNQIDVVILDQASWMYSARNTFGKFEKLDEISTEVRQAQMNCQIPFILLHQFNRSAQTSGKEDDDMSAYVYGSDKFRQDCSLMVGLTTKKYDNSRMFYDDNGNDINRYNFFLRLEILKSRRTNKKNATIDFAVDYNYGKFIHMNPNKPENDRIFEEEEHPMLKEFIAACAERNSDSTFGCGDDIF